MWLGTSDGLNRFDGRNFVVYRNIAGDSTSLANNIINALCLDQLGHVWAATNGGICYYDFEDDGFHHITFPDTLEKIDRYRVHAVSSDKQGNIWFATRTHLHRWHEGQQVESIAVPADSLLMINYLNADDKGQVWIGMNDGLIRYLPATKKFTHLVISSPFSIQQKFPATVHPVLPYQKDTLIVGSWYGGVQKIFPDQEGLRNIPLTDDHETDSRKHIIRGMCAGPNGIFWVGTYGNGLSIFDSRKADFTAHYHHDAADAKSLSDDYVNDVYIDRTGIVWIGTDAGLDKYDPFTQQFQSISIPPASGGVFCLS
jgi:ligand-binding sensor domain-containing protein